MQYIKFSLAVFILCNITFASSKFTSKQCLDSKFDTVVKDQKKYFGLITEKFSLKKDGCLITATYKGILETRWVVDVCREPLHIKVHSKGNLAVYKFTEECKAMENDYCYHVKELKKYMQDEGLIFADGEKENLATPHGQVYCSYLLLKRYLDDKNIFSKYSTDVNVFESKTETCDIPKQVAPPVTRNIEVITPTEPLIEEKKENIIEENKRKF